MDETTRAIATFIAQERTAAAADRSYLEILQHFSSDHDVILKTVIVFAAVFGAAIMRYGFSLASRFFQVVTIGVGGFITVAAFLAFSIIGIIAPFPFDMQDRQFEEGEKGVAKLYYQGHIPILQVTYDKASRRQAGFDQGYLLGPSIETIASRLATIGWISGMPKSQDLKAALRKMSSTIPKKYREELEGLADGYNAWVGTKWWGPKKMTYDDLLLLHLIPDRVMNRLRRWDAWYANQERTVPVSTTQQPMTGCTTIIAKEKKRGTLMLRTLDWNSAGVLGTLTLVRNSIFKDGAPSTVEIGFPGLVGSLTGMKANGFTVVMNVCAKESTWIEGMPAVFYNRMMLEECNTVKEAEGKVAGGSPLGPYHLMVMDQRRARAFHFYQGRERSHTSRALSKAAPLVVTNGSYDEKAQHTAPMFYSREREAIIERLRQKMPELSPRKFLEVCAELPYVNNPLTTLVAHMEPKARKISLAWQNSFAGTILPLELDTAPLFAAADTR